LLLVGHGPVVETLATLAGSAGYEVAVLPEAAVPSALSRLALGPGAAVVVATHGELDEDALTRVLATSAGYVSLVASRKRAASILATLQQRGVPRAHLARLKAPAGLDIGAVTPEEIAVSILAEAIQARRSGKADHLEALPLDASARTEATDPICGMMVEVATARHQSDWAGRSVYFCCRRCKDAFDADPSRYAAPL
jgi:xanthine dehydrogenase accessory factor